MRLWDPFRELEDLRREFDRTLRGRSAWRWPFSRVSFLPGISARHYPLINISGDADNFLVEALAPGIKPDTLDISVVRNTLTIQGEKAEPAEGVNQDAFHRNERAAGRFVRTLELSSDIEEENVKAEYKDGLLTITLPKAETAKPKKITVSTE